MALLDDNDNSRGGLLADIVEEALKAPPPNDPDEPRDPVWLRWVKFGAVIIGPAIVFGLVFLFGDYLMQYNSRDYVRQQRAERAVQHDSVAAMKWRFIVGAGVGAALGSVYVVRCLIRKVDP